MNALRLISNNGFTPKHLKPWAMPASYFGATHEGSYVFLGQHRGSDVLTRSNFECGLNALGGTSDTVEQIHEGHWGFGWVEWIKIDASDTRALIIADKIAGALEDYPVIDESHFSDMEHEENIQILSDNLDYFMRDLCKELDLDSDNLTRGESLTLNALIDAVFFYEASYSGEAWFCVNRLKDSFDNVVSDVYLPKKASKRMLSKIKKHFN